MSILIALTSLFLDLGNDFYSIISKALAFLVLFVLFRLLTTLLSGNLGRNKLKDWELNLLKEVLKRHPNEYLKLSEQLEEGLLKGVKIIPSPNNYVSFVHNKDIASKYQSEEERIDCLKGIKAFNIPSNEYIDVEIYISSGLIIGYATPTTKKVKLDSNRIDIKNLEKEMVRK